MNVRWSTLGLGSVMALGAALLATEAVAQSSVTYGRITAVRQVNLDDNQGAQVAGAVIAGTLAATAGSGRSRSNRALRGIGGAAVGSQLAGAATSSTGFEYTVLLGGTRSVQVVAEKAGLRVGDCVSVERGAFNNIRLAADERCDAASSTELSRAEEAADACAVATQQLLDAEADDEFDRAERRMRLLCD